MVGEIGLSLIRLRSISSYHIESIGFLVFCRTTFRFCAFADLVLKCDSIRGVAGSGMVRNTNNDENAHGIHIVVVEVGSRGR